VELSTTRLESLPTEQAVRDPRAAALAVLEAMRLDSMIGGLGQAGDADAGAKEDGFQALVAKQSEIARRYAEF
jgi:hypothetical protein